MIAIGRSQYYGMEHGPVNAAYQAAEAHYTARNLESRRIYNEAVKHLPGGNTRTVLYYDPFPLATVRAEGARLFDADGHEYVDLLGEYTAGLYGHSEPAIMAAILEALQSGLNFGSHHANEAALARLIKLRFPSIDLVRFTNSGTEATLMALAAARVYTRKNRILVFEGGYHGGAFSFAHGDSPVNAPYKYLVARYNSVESVDAVLSDPTNAQDLAAIIVEPMLGSGGGIPGKRLFLDHLRKTANTLGAVLIFDEVMTSRLHSGGGLQSHLDIRPDMTTLGKYIGGGMSFGAFGGTEDIMSLFDPRTGKIAHAGTFNNNVLTMAAGRAGLEKIFTPDAALKLNARGEALRQRLNQIATGSLLKVSGCQSIMVIHFTLTPEEHITCPQDIADDDKALSDLLHLYLLEHGYYIARRGFIALSLAVTDTDLDGFVKTIQEFLTQHQSLVTIREKAQL
ncbi:hypothetical protein LTR66_012056 [Elasticomyces elasticus]|nr:hypothetical protein LTR66_012056 [Elasticomyces elasticus]KAK4993625.1 putative secondary metabolism biosynthetic enzyme [Elasticomyces elasticus]